MGLVSKVMMGGEVMMDGAGQQSDDVWAGHVN